MLALRAMPEPPGRCRAKAAPGSGTSRRGAILLTFPYIKSILLEGLAVIHKIASMGKRALKENNSPWPTVPTIGLILPRRRHAADAVLDAGLRAYMLRVFNWMTSGLC